MAAHGGRFLKDNSLSIVLLGLFLVCWVGHALTGWHRHDQQQRDHRQPGVTLSSYLRSPDFLESTFENWESEFFQMAAFLLLSAKLVQRGSAESKKPDDEQDEREEHEVHPGDPAKNVQPDSPWPVHRGGLALRLYSHSLTLGLTLLFVISFALHGITGRERFNDEAAEHGRPAVTVAGYMTSSTFWFESFQNWQSEFLSVAALVLMSIFLRQHGSPESKPVHAPHAQTGTE